MPSHDSEFIQSLDSRIYWQATKEVYDSVFAPLADDMGEADAAVEILDRLTQITRDSEDNVHEIQQERVKRGEIQDTSQSTVSVVGNNFQALVGYAVEINRLVGNVPESIQVALKPKNHPVLEEYGTIEVAEGEVQKPDIDLLIYSDDVDDAITMFSCKTSLRERAGQTYRWRLLMDMALCDCTHEKGCPMHRYDLHYEPDRDILLSLVTADFYDERESAQQKGTFTFFDNVFVTREVDNRGNVGRLSGVIDTLNDVYR